MDVTVGRVTSLEQRVRTMDMELKEYFLEMRTFTSGALAGVESRLGARIDGVEKGLGSLGSRIDRVERGLGSLSARIDGLETRLGRFERDVKAGFQVVDGRLGRVERRLDQIELKLDLGIRRIDLKLDTVIRRLPSPARGTGSMRPRTRKPGR